MKLTQSQKDLRLLNQAISMAEDWRGAEIGNPDPAPLKAFDRKIKRMRAAIERLWEEERQRAPR